MSLDHVFQVSALVVIQNIIKSKQCQDLRDVSVSVALNPADPPHTGLPVTQWISQW